MALRMLTAADYRLAMHDATAMYSILMHIIVILTLHCTGPQRLVCCLMLFLWSLLRSTMLRVI